MSKSEHPPERNRVLMVGPKTYPPEIGGIETHVYEVSKRLARDGWSITVLIPSRDMSRREEDSDGVVVRRVRSIGGRYALKLSALPSILKEVRSGSADLIHAHDVVGAFACSARRKGVPFVYSLHGIGHGRREWPTPFRQGVRIMQAVALRNADHVFATDRASAAVGGVHADEVEVLANGVDSCTFSPIDSDTVHLNRDRPFTVLFVGRLTEVKGVRDILAVISTLPHSTRKDMRFVFVGDGPLSGDVRRAMTDTPQIEWTGSVGYGKMARFYKEADVFILPSYSEGLPLSLLEAMAAGVPTITSDVGGVSTDVPRDITVLIQPGDTEELARALVTAREDPRSMAEMAARARAHVVHRHSWGATAERVSEIYRRLLEGNLVA